MNNKNKQYHQPLIEMPDAMKQLPAETASVIPVDFIDSVPEHLRVHVAEGTARELGDVALVADKGGRFNNGTVQLSPDQVGPQAIRQNGQQVAPDTYVIPTMHTDREE